MNKPPELRQIPPRRVWFEAVCSNTETCGHRHTVYFSALRCAQEHGRVGVVANLDGLRLDLFEIYTAETDTQTVIWRIVTFGVSVVVDGMMPNPSSVYMVSTAETILPTPDQSRAKRRKDV